MADCPYARCIQERRHIRRELLRWTKNMVFVVGLERVAEELMGRRRWKQYQDTLYTGTRSESSTTTQQQQALHQRLYPTPPGCNLDAAALNQVAHLRPQVLPAQIKQELLTPKNLSNHHPTQEDQQDHPEQRHQEESNCVKVEVENSEVVVQDSRTETTTTTTVTTNNTNSTGVKRRNRGDDENGNEEEEEDEAEKRLKPNHQNDESTNHLNENDRTSKEEDPTKPNDTEGTKERIEGVALERIQVTQGLLRVKKEEELQEAPVPGSGLNSTSAATTNSLSATKEPEVIPENVFLGNRIVSPPPEDWKPLDKCYFCLDGKLPHDDQPPLSPQSESSSSSRSAESPMSVQVDPMAASVVAAALGTYPTLLPQWCLPPREAPHVNVQAHQDNASGADQPLDLSAKPKNSQKNHRRFHDNNISLLEQQKIPLRMPAGLDPKAIFNSCYRAKPRLTGPAGVGGVSVVGAGGGRRTYTEEELQAALRDIQSGKLGTRRAAVIYGIPRSTLRNKVYKLAMERERDASLTNTISHPHESGVPAATITTTTSTTTTTTTTITPNTTQNASATTLPAQVDEADEKELSGAEEEKEVEKALLKPLLSLEDLVRFSALEGSGGDSLRTLLQRGQETGTEWPGFEHANIGPYIQKMLAAATPFKGLAESQDYRIPEVMRRLMSEDKRLSKDVNGDQSSHHQQHAQQQNHSQQQQHGSMTNEDFNPSIEEEEEGDSGQGRAILKIPSYKPANTPGSSKNGEPNSAAFAQSFAQASGAVAGSPGLMERSSPAFSGTSSPTNSLVGKGVGVNFRDVIAKSISVKFQEGQSPGGIQGQGGLSQSPQSMISESNPFKRGRYTPPQTAQQQQQKQQQSQSQDKQGKPGTGGKGTRPKRGKYRNYDRDSLVEAVRAVQRGEMSVHRAGSYYGVPHSTLEYKVKERHLMRPRKRDQKPPDDKAKETVAAPGTMRPGAPDKKPQLKPQKPFTPPGGMPGPNGMKMPPFMEGMPPLPFAHPFNFWGPAPFMPSPFMGGAPNVPGMMPEQYFATQRMRGLQEQQRNAIVQQHQQRDRDGNTGSAEPGTSNSRGSIVKSTREMAESLYDGTGANGSFLDNLIRSSLETGITRDQRAMAEARSQQQQQQQQQQQAASQHHPEALSSKALIDQLCRNSRRTPLPRMTQDSSEDESYRSSSGRSIPERPERVPTVDLSPSPSERGRTDDGSDRLTTPPTPLPVSRASSREEDRDPRIDRSSREREVLNGGSEDRERKTLNLQQSLNHYPDLHNLYAVSTDKKSACDSKLIVDHSSQKTQQQQQEYAAVSGLVVQLQRGYNSGTNRSGDQPSNNQSQEQRSSAVLMEDSVEQ